MIVEINGGNSGIAEYLEKGLKQGRLFARDELDTRLVLSGDLELTHKLIESIENTGQERYLHITLSFREDDISSYLLQSIVEDYKELLMSAYKEDEYNFYAEAHLPKIKYIEDQKTGEMIARKPHIHIVIPEINLLTGKNLVPTGYVNKNLSYLDSIQEYINYKYNLESPKDFMREGGHHSANVLSRIKGDFFGEKQSNFKAKLVDEIAKGNINSLAEFNKYLSEFGEVKIRNKGKSNQYFSVKIGDDKKFTNLKHPIFSEKAIVSKKLPKEKIEDVIKKVDEWKNRVSKEIKFVDFATPSFRQKYAKSNVSEKAELLIEREQNYERKYRQSTSINATKRQSRNNKSNLIKINKRATGIIAGTSVSLSSMQDRNLVYRAFERRSRTQSILPEDELNYLRNRKSSVDSALRRNDPSGRRGNARRIGNKPPISTRAYFQISAGVPTQTYQKNIFDKDIDKREFITDFDRYIRNEKIKRSSNKYSQSNILSSLVRQYADNAEYKAELDKFAEIRRNIDPKAFLDHLKRVYAIEPENYKVYYANDGSPRFNVGKRNLNASDLLTKHLNLSWDEAKNVLTFCYEQQQNKNLNQERLAYAQIKRNIQAFDNDIRFFEKQVRFQIENLEIDNRNAYKREKKRIYGQSHCDTKKRNQELAIASFRCMQRKELIDKFEKNAAIYIRNARQFFQQSGYSIQSLEEYDNMAKLNTISPAIHEREQQSSDKPFETAFEKQKAEFVQHQQIALTRKQFNDVYQTQAGDELKEEYQGNVRFKNPNLQDTLEKNNIGVAKHKDGTIEYKSLNDGKLICTDTGDKMIIKQQDLSPQNVKFFLEVSVDRYGNELNINGNKAFKDMVVDVAAANNLPVILKPAELQEQLIARRKELEIEQKAEMSIERAAKENVIQKAIPEQVIESKIQSEPATSVKVDQPQKQTERAAYTIEFKYDEAAKQRTSKESELVAGRFYSVYVNKVPVTEAIKNDPNIAKVLENAVKNSTDLQAKGITADSLKSGQVFGLQEGTRFAKPETLKLNGVGQQLQSQADKSITKGKSDISL
ncbi:LPD7 domain-containing protein [Gallibacterium anatis]|uniref:LPD7 domain-containing protein n=1 Tax=Gallibacterium anatis TaxID=750 RepID=UPI0039FCAFCF